MGLEEDFEQAAKDITPVVGVPVEEMLELYALFKQAKFGDNTTSKPGIFDPKGRKKWEVWTSKKGMTKEAAMKLYVEIVNRLLEKLGAEQPEPQAA